MKKSKGFTLIELLAVITILGIVMLIAAIGVLPMIEKSKAKSLLNEGRELVKAAELAYTENSSLRKYDDLVLSLNFLSDLGYYDKQSSSYSGAVHVEKNGKKVEYHFSISDGTYGYKRKPLSVGDNTDYSRRESDDKTDAEYNTAFLAYTSTVSGGQKLYDYLKTHTGVKMKSTGLVFFTNSGASGSIPSVTELATVSD